MTLAEVDYLRPFGYWFLITLFLMEMLAIPLVTLVRNKKVLAIITIILFVLWCGVDYTAISYVQQTLAALIFGLAGYLSKPLLVKHKPKNLGWITLLTVAVMSMYNDPIAMYLNEYGNKIWFLLVALLGIYSVFDISVSLRNTNFFQWCGQESIILYVLQFSVIRVVVAACTMLIPSFSGSLYPCYIIAFFIVLIILIPCTWVCSNYLRFAFGRR